MSTYWGLRCKTCDVISDHDFNHGEEILRGLVRATPHIKAALDADKSGYLEFSIMAHGYSAIMQFAVWEHAGHDLELNNEYGESEPIEEQEKSMSKKPKEVKERLTTIQYTGRSGDRHTFASADKDEVKAKYDVLFAKYVKGEIRSITLDME